MTSCLPVFFPDTLYFSVARAWVGAEGEPEPEAAADGSEGDGLGGMGGGSLAGASVPGTGPSFTRVVIGDLKPEVLRQMMDDEQGSHICQVGRARGHVARSRTRQADGAEHKRMAMPGALASAACLLSSLLLPSTLPALTMVLSLFCQSTRSWPTCTTTTCTGSRATACREAAPPTVTDTCPMASRFRTLCCVTR